MYGFVCDSSFGTEIWRNGFVRLVWVFHSDFIIAYGFYGKMEIGSVGKEVIIN